MGLNFEIKDILTNKSSFYSIAKNEIRLGRAKESEITIANKYISSLHMTIIQDGDRIFIRDEKSSNGSEIFLQNKWEKLNSRKREITLPCQIKLAGAVVASIQSGESLIVPLSEIQKDASIMVLDICGSTNQALRNEEIAFHLKQRLNNIAKPILFSAPVNFYKNTGDGFLATFDKTTQAVNCAVKILKTLEKRNGKTKNPPIHVRIGLHHGQTYTIDPATEDIHGIDINITFRIEGLRKKAITGDTSAYRDKDRILATGAFYRIQKKQTRRKKELFTLLGTARLKGISERVEIYNINWK